MSGHAEQHEDTAQISRDAARWVLQAGAFAIALSAFIIGADYYLSHSDKEAKLGATLRELRTAQASMKERTTDERQTQSFLDKR